MIDKVEEWYPTTYQSFRFSTETESHSNGESILLIHQTSFGCGRLGATFWPSALALGCYLMKNYDWIAGKRVLELGSGCGIPSVVCRDLCGAAEILDRDFWEEDAADPTIGQRLVPDNLFGVNINHNVGEENALKLDWHNTKVVNFEFSKFNSKEKQFPADRVNFGKGEDQNPWEGILRVK